jgi:hypothetical protein
MDFVRDVVDLLHSFSVPLSSYRARGPIWISGELIIGPHPAIMSHIIDKTGITHAARMGLSQCGLILIDLDSDTAQELP